MTDENVIDFETRRARKQKATATKPEPEVPLAATEPRPNAEIVEGIRAYLDSLDEPETP